MTGRATPTGPRVRAGDVDLPAVPRPLVDSHLHTFELARHPQPWIDPATMGVLYRDFAVGDARLADRGVTACVVVQSLNSTAETLDLLAAADRCAETAGVVGWVDLTADVPAAIDALRAAAGGHKLVGVRHLAHLEPDPEWLLRADVTAGLAAVAAVGLPFDLIVRSWQLGVAAAVADRHPDLRLVLDHLGNPPVADDLTDWSRGLADLARRPHVGAKISGLATAGRFDRWTTDDLRRPVDVALAAFGADRLMYGSDWPLVRLAGGEERWQQAYLELTAAWSPAERVAVDRGCAGHTYRVLR